MASGFFGLFAWARRLVPCHLWTGLFRCRISHGLSLLSVSLWHLFTWTSVLALSFFCIGSCSYRCNTIQARFVLERPCYWWWWYLSRRAVRGYGRGSSRAERLHLLFRCYGLDLVHWLADVLYKKKHPLLGYSAALRFGLHDGGRARAVLDSSPFAFQLSKRACSLASPQDVQWELFSSLSTLWDHGWCASTTVSSLLLRLSCFWPLGAASNWLILFDTALVVLGSFLIILSNKVFQAHLVYFLRLP